MSLEKLNPLQRRAAQLSAQGLSDVEVKDTLALSVTTWEAWRSDVTFTDAVTQLKATSNPADDKAAKDARGVDGSEGNEPDGFNSATDEAFAR